MDDIPAFALSLVGGALLGAFFFAGLWWSVRKGLASESPALWFLGSLLVRTGVILAGFYLVSQGHWSRLVACLIGFVAARIVVVRKLAQGPLIERTPLEEETHIAPFTR